MLCKIQLPPPYWVVVLALLLATATLSAQPSPPCDDGETFDVQFEQRNIMNCDEEISFLMTDEVSGDAPSSASVHSTSGMSYQSFQYSSSTGVATFTNVSITSYQEYGQVTFQVETPNGICYIVANIVACCEDVGPDVIAVDEPLNNYGTSFTNDVLYIFGNVTLATGPASFDFTNCEFKLGPDAQLEGEEDLNANFEGCLLEPYCDCRWDRIFLPDNSTSITMDDCQVYGALRGVMAESNAAVELIDVDFLNNFISLHLEDYSTQGNFNDSWIKVDGCLFNLTQAIDTYCYDDQQSQVNMAPYADICDGGNSHPVVDVRIVNSDYINIGHDTYSTNQFQNTFLLEDKTSINALNAQVFIRNNEFTDLSFAICSNNDSRLVVGGTTAQGNSFEGTAIEIIESSIFMDENTITDLRYVKIEDPTFTQVASGYDAGSQLSKNIFTDSDLKVDGFNNDTWFRIYDNEFYDSHIDLKDVPASGTGGQNRLIFHSNFAERTDEDEMLYVSDCHGMTFANNEFENLVFYTPSGSSDYTGVIWEDNEDAMASNNYFDNCNRGFDLKGDNQGSQFTCNTFHNCYHGFWLDNTFISEQGSSSEATDNCWTYLYGTPTFPYGESVSGSVSQTVKWHMSPPSSCTSGGQPANDCECVFENVSGNFTVQANATSNACNVPNNKSSIQPSSESEKDAEEDDKEKKELLLYPNPTNGLVHILVPENATAQSLDVYNLQGQRIEEIAISSTEITVNTKAWPTGIYIVKTGNHQARLLVK